MGKKSPTQVGWPHLTKNCKGAMLTMLPNDHGTVEANYALTSTQEMSYRKGAQ